MASRKFLWHVAFEARQPWASAFRDAVREYLEIAVLTVIFRPTAKPARLVELIHRAIPYPLLLAARTAKLSASPLAQNAGRKVNLGKVVIEELRVTAPFRPENPTTEETQFLARLSVVGLPQTDLFALYQSWLNAILALEAAQITGAFRPPIAENSAALRDSLDARAQALRDLALLRTRAENETQLSRRVDTNLAIKELEARIAEVAKNL